MGASLKNMQLALPDRMSFHVSPTGMEFDSLMRKLYPPPKRAYFYERNGGVSGLGCNPGETKDNGDGSQSQCNSDGSTWSAYTAPSEPSSGPYTNPVFNYDYQAQQQAAGLPSGPPPALMSYNDLLAQAQLANCDPKDVTCVANNVARQAAVEQYWVNNSEHVPVGTVLSFSNLTPSQVNDFHSQITGQGGNVVDSSGILQASTGGGASASAPIPQTGPPSTSPAPAKPNQSIPPTTALTPMNTGIQNTGQVLQTMVTNAAADASNLLGTVATDTGLSSSTLLLVGGAAVVLFLMMRGKK